MASDCQRPSSLMMSGSTSAQSSAVAPPGRRERAEMSLAEMPVVCSSSSAAWRRALVTWTLLMEYQARWSR